jgi:hypothetical protein
MIALIDFHDFRSSMIIVTGLSRIDDVAGSTALGFEADPKAPRILYVIACMVRNSIESSAELLSARLPPPNVLERATCWSVRDEPPTGTSQSSQTKMKVPDMKFG